MPLYLYLFIYTYIIFFNLFYIKIVLLYIIHLQSNIKNRKAYLRALLSVDVRQHLVSIIPEICVRNEFGPSLSEVSNNDKYGRNLYEDKTEGNNFRNSPVPTTCQNRYMEALINVKCGSLFGRKYRLTTIITLLYPQW